MATLLVLACAAACGEARPAERVASEASWQRLARGFVPGSPEVAIRGWGGVRGRAEPDGSGVWIETDIPRENWRRLRDVPGNAWFAVRTDAGGFRHHQGERAQLRADGEALAAVAEEILTAGDLELVAGLFSVTPQSTLLALPEGEALPERCVLSSYMERGRAENGVWRATLGGLMGEGLTVWSGEEVTLGVRVPPRSSLSFRAACKGFGATGEVTFRVWIGDELLLEQRQACTQDRSAEFLRVALPEGGVPAAELRFAVSGDPALAAFLEPVLGPTDVGDYGARPWSDARPDVVLFLADTFRADNLAKWGGAPEVAPRLNRLASESRCYLRARSTGVWTLPSHGSLFTGLYPLQHGAVANDRSLPGELVTVAEHLSEAGYRTAAVTEGAFVSRHFGMAQGFGWFEERTSGARLLRSTLAGALDAIDADDGRPLFLFVHTYRTHAPYRIGPDEDTGPEKELLKRIGARMLELERAGKPGISPELVLEFQRPYHDLYLGGVTALDRALEPWLAELDGRGLMEHGYFLFTSDHGEEFYEHGNRFHGTAPHEEKIRVPFLIHGPGIPASDVLAPVSHVDLAPTLAELARLPALPIWEGRSILAEHDERPMFAHNQTQDATSYIVVVEGQRKVFAADGAALARGEIDAAFDLDSDPGEQQDLLEGEAAWPRELARRLAPLWQRLTESLGEPGAVELEGAALLDLKHLGYAE